jgi:electron transfer flavoprotein alpha subunit
LADKYAAVIARLMSDLDFATVVGVSSTFTKDVMPRVAALCDAGMLSNVAAVDHRDGKLLFRRPICSGSMHAWVRLGGARRVLTALATGMEMPPVREALSPVERLEIDSETLPDGMSFVSRELPDSSRPDLTEARVVVGGGRPLKDPDTFERLIGGLADAFGGAVGATRAAVDGGMAPNDCQIGQTGKVVAPDLYFAVGVSGAIQHWAGFKDAKVIVAINRDPNAPIFQSSTYGLVGDLFEIVPQLIESVARG